MATLTFVIYCLSEHPDILLALREEILAKVGPTRRPTFDDVKECKFLRAVINGMFVSNCNDMPFKELLGISRNASSV